MWHKIVERNLLVRDPRFSKRVTHFKSIVVSQYRTKSVDDAFGECMEGVTIEARCKFRTASTLNTPSDFCSHRP